MKILKRQIKINPYAIGRNSWVSMNLSSFLENLLPEVIENFSKILIVKIRILRIFFLNCWYFLFLLIFRNPEKILLAQHNKTQNSYKLLKSSLGLDLVENLAGTQWYQKKIFWSVPGTRRYPIFFWPVPSIHWYPTS